MIDRAISIYLQYLNCLKCAQEIATGVKNPIHSFLAKAFVKAPTDTVLLKKDIVNITKCTCTLKIKYPTTVNFRLCI